MYTLAEVIIIILFNYVHFNHHNIILKLFHKMWSSVVPSKNILIQIFTRIQISRSL